MALKNVIKNPYYTRAANKINVFSPLLLFTINLHDIFSSTFLDWRGVTLEQFSLTNVD
jgi:hypothetical protein